MDKTEPAAIVSRRAVVEQLRRAGWAGVTQSALARALSESEAGERALKRALPDVLAEAVERGEAIRAGNGRYFAIEFSDNFVGTLRMTSRGFGIVRQTDGAPDIVIPPEHLGTALDGDRVMVYRGSKRRRGELVPDRYGEVVRVLTRRRSTLVGRFTEGAGGQAWVEPYNRRLLFNVHVEVEHGERPREGEFVEVSLDHVPETGPVSGRLLRRLGAPGESGVDEDVVLAEAGIPVEFPPEALAEAAAMPDRVRPEDLEGREDLRDHPAVTIDGETAKDFDDAVVAFPAADGAIEVWVHIADVSHYVRRGSALDAAARERGTSVYLPGRAIPMLPEQLSSHLCSLLPEQDRLAFSVRYLVLPSGAVEGYRATRAVFRSRRRCTYTEVHRWVERGEWPDLPEGVRASVALLHEAAQRLNRRRRERGAIDFDLPEPEILLDPEGFMTGVVAAERNVAHRLIEEHMLAANECIARMLVHGRQPGVFRVHERPSEGKLAELQAVLEEFDLELKGNLEELPPLQLQRLLDRIAGRPEERFLQTLILRALARAVYLPECKGHYALATDFYLHFTSPIRRYPDLVVHRSLAGRRLAGVERDAAISELEDVARHSSFTERRADDAEREVVKWKQAEYMRAHVGEEFSGHVSGVVAFGLFVQLEEVFVEGMVHISELRDDFYRYDETGHRLVGQRFGRVLRLGDPLRVRVLGIDEEHMEAKLAPVLEPLGEGRRPRRGEEIWRAARERGRRRRAEEQAAPGERPAGNKAAGKKPRPAPRRKTRPGKKERVAAKSRRG